MEYLLKNDKHICRERIENKIKAKEIIIMRVGEKIVDWLRYGYFWDDIPFTNMLYFNEDSRRKGHGSNCKLLT